MIARWLTVKVTPAPSRMRRNKGRIRIRTSASRSRIIWISSIRACAKIRLMVFRLFFLGYFALLTGLLHHTNEHVLERETCFFGAYDSNSEVHQDSCGVSNAAVSGFVRDDMKVVAEQ